MKSNATPPSGSPSSNMKLKIETLHTRQLDGNRAGMTAAATTRTVAKALGRVESEEGMKPICKVCGVPGCIEARGADFHKGTRFGSLKCDYTGKPPFADDDLCVWCAGTGHPYGDESYGLCKCPKRKPT